MTTRIRYSDAIVEALRMEMHRDPSIVLVGGDEQADELASAFGADRSVAVGRSDQGRIAVAAGAAASGLRVVAEAPLETLGPALVADLAAAVAAADEGQAPLVVRIPFGASAAGAPASRRALEGLFAIEGLAIVAPATPADAKGLLASALHGSAPVCILEHESLGGHVGGVPEGGHQVAIGTARVAASGSRLTIISSGPASLLAEEAAEREEELTVLDLRSLRPLDRDLILDCVRGTGKVLIIEQHDCPAPGNEITALIAGEAFEYLDGPIRRLQLDPADPGARDRLKAACDELLSY
jgi:pyruvate/2-oxoglutarate/acetoin dehydrogenase E1 component